MKNIAFFVHYNTSNRISERTTYALENIRNLYDKVVVISNSKLTEKEFNRLNNYCDKLIVRQNIGFDFAAWRDGIKAVGWKELSTYDTVTLVNDTCLFPLFPIEKTIKKFNRNKNVDFWGASIHGQTDNGMPGINGPVPEHVQSYFMVFKKNVVASSVFQKFWNGIKNLTEVNEVISKYETQLTPTLKKHGFNYDAIYNPNNYDDEDIIDAVYQIPDLLIKRRFPFLKVKAINDSNIESLIKNIKLSRSLYPVKFLYKSNKSFRRIFDFLVINTHWLFLIIALLSSLTFMRITPIGFGGDEESHIYRAYHISTGHLFTENLEGGNSGFIPVSISNAAKKGYFIASSSIFGSSINGRQDISNNEAQVLEELGNTTLNPNETRPEKFSNTSAYNPVMYAGAALGFRLSSMSNLSVERSVFLARLLNAMPFFAISTLAIFVLRGLRARWLVFFILLFPTVISYVATINGDPYNIAAVMLFFAVYIKYVISPQNPLTKKYSMLLVASTILLATAKLPSALLSLLILFIPAKKLGTRKNKWSIVSVIFVLMSLLLLLNTFTGGGGAHNSGITKQLEWIFQNPIGTIGVFTNTLYAELPDYINRAIGVMGRNGVFAYPVVITILFTWMIILALWIDKSSKKNAIMSVITGLMFCLMIITLLYLADNKIGSSIVWGVHGKYFTPFIPFILYGLTALPIRVNSKLRYIECGTIFISVIALFSSIIMFNLALY